jgi:hypothetical protein
VRGIIKEGFMQYLLTEEEHKELVKVNRKLLRFNKDVELINKNVRGLLLAIGAALLNINNQSCCQYCNDCTLYLIMKKAYCHQRDTGSNFSGKEIVNLICDRDRKTFKEDTNV